MVDVHLPPYALRHKELELEEYVQYFIYVCQVEGNILHKT